MLLARTDWDVPKHRGITFFALPMQQPGVEVRPLRQMNGHATFNEVFFTDARVADADRVGEAGEGWRVAVTTLMHERGAVAGRRPKFPKDEPAAAPSGRPTPRPPSTTRPTSGTRSGRAGPSSPRCRPEAMGCADDPIVRQHVSALRELQQTSAVERPAGPGGPVAGSPAGARGIPGQAQHQHHRPGRGPGPRRDRRRPRHAVGPRLARRAA